MASPAWQRKEGKSKSGGLNRKGIASTFLNLNRSNEIINITCKMMAIEITPSDMVYVDLPRFSYSSRPYRVMNVERIEPPI